jgi:uncharacterized membrane protein
VGACLVVGTWVAASNPVLGAGGNQGGKPPPDPAPVPETPIAGYYFWRLGHMDGPHDLSMALGISRDAKVAVGSTKVVDFTKAFRIDIDWAISTGDGVAPLYNELQVQESIGGKAAYAASNKALDACPYSRLDPEAPSSVENLDWCGSLPVGTLTKGTVSYAAQWLWAYDPEALEPNYVAIPDFGGGISDMVAHDVSADGRIIVGTGNTKTGLQAFRADTSILDEEGVPIPQQLTITDMFYTEQTLQTSSAQAVSADGTIIAGYGGTKIGNKAFITTFLGVDEATGEPLLESYVLPAIAGGKWCEAYALTVTEGNLIYVAGRSDSPKGPQACIWFQGDDPATPDVVETWLVKGIGGLSTKKYNSVATGIVHRPGSTAGELLVVGNSQSILYPSEAFVWTGNPVLVPDGPYTLPDGNVGDYIGYMYDLEKILIKTGAGEASGMGSAWVLNGATGVALSSVLNAGDNGPSARMVGWGTNPEGGTEAWLVTNFPYDDLLFIKE